MLTLGPRQTEFSGIRTSGHLLPIYSPPQANLMLFPLMTTSLEKQPWLLSL